MEKDEPDILSDSYSMFEKKLKQQREKNRPEVEIVEKPPPNYYDGVDACNSK